METIADKLGKVLGDLGTTGDVEASALVSRDGLLMASNITNGYRPETFGALGASMLDVVETASSVLNKGEVSRIIIETKNINIITEIVDVKSLIVTTTKNQSELRPILTEIEKAAEKVKKAL
ncbi:MAG: roadblock/LC7 domain-containing protein [Halobacteriota archaeon]|nr:roadblock/LC7 domain-containing protein [Halobacteriota archaeon]